MSRYKEPVIEAIARARWNAPVTIDGRTLFPKVADWDNVGENTKREWIADVEAFLDAIDSAGFIVKKDSSP